MPKTVKISFTSKNTGESGTAKATFSDADWDRLLEFVAEAERLFQTQAIRGGFSVNHNVRWDRDSGLTTTVRLPQDDDIAAVLHRLRPFILEQERLNFLSICNLLACHLDHPGLRATIPWHRELFTGKQFQSMVTIKSDHLCCVSRSLRRFRRTVSRFLRQRELAASRCQSEAWINDAIERMP